MLLKAHVTADYILNDRKQDWVHRRFQQMRMIPNTP